MKKNKKIRLALAHQGVMTGAKDGAIGYILPDSKNQSNSTQTDIE